jgi:hypothetical protein
MKLKRFFLIICLSTTAGAASAVPIDYIFTGNGSGYIGTKAFSYASFTITQHANTDNIAYSGGFNFYMLQGTTSISIDRIGTFSFNQNLALTFVPSSGFGSGSVGLVNQSLNIFSYNPLIVYSVNGFDIHKSFEPVYAYFNLSDSWAVSPVDTSGGKLFFAKSSGSGTFQSIAAVPIPAGAWLFCSSLLGLVTLKRKTNR